MASYQGRFGLEQQPEVPTDAQRLSPEQLEVQGALLALLEGDEDERFSYAQPQAQSYVQLPPGHPRAYPPPPFPAFQHTPTHELWPAVPPAPRFDPASPPAPTSVPVPFQDAFASHPAAHYPHTYAMPYYTDQPPPERLVHPPTFQHAPGRHASQGMWGRQNGRGGGRGWHEAPAPSLDVESYSPVQPQMFGWQPPPPSFAHAHAHADRAPLPTPTSRAPTTFRPGTASASISAIFDAPRPPTASPPPPAHVVAPPPRGALPAARTFQFPQQDRPSPGSTAYNPTASPSSSTSSSSRSSRALRPTDLLPAANLAASNRERFGTTATGAWNSKPTRKTTPATASPADPERIDRRKGSKLTADHRTSCSRCGKELAVLIYRGTRDEIRMETEGGYRCGACEPLPERPAGGNDESGDDELVGWDDTLSAAVDRLQGIDLNEAEDGGDERGLPPSRARTSILLGRKRRAEDEVLMCDVCTREIGTGGLIVAGSDHEEVPFSIECVCIKCHELYQRCSDCGGSGGPRLGVGKWRCKELFPGGRKTCRLSHLRMGPLSDMTYDVWQVHDLPPAELEDFIVLARDLYMYQIVAGLATPEMLEPVTALARTYDQVQKMAVDSWTMVEPLLRDDIESERGARRYVGIRWSNPPPRKRKGAMEDIKPEPGEEHDRATLIRSGKNLASYVLSEVDLAIGSLCISIQTPWTTGDTFNATTQMMRTLLRRIDSDILADNAARAALREPLPAYPRLRQAWIMMFFKKDSRLYRDLLNRRSFIPLDEYVAKFGGDPAHFAPIRPVFLPREYLKGWHVLVRQVVENDEWGGRSAAEVKKEKKLLFSGPAFRSEEGRPPAVETIRRPPIRPLPHTSVSYQDYSFAPLPSPRHESRQSTSAGHQPPPPATCSGSSTSSRGSTPGAYTVPWKSSFESIEASRRSSDAETIEYGQTTSCSRTVETDMEDLLAGSRSRAHLAAHGKRSDSFGSAAVTMKVEDAELAATPSPGAEVGDDVKPTTDVVTPFISKLSHLLSHQDYAEFIRWNSAGDAFVFAHTSSDLLDVFARFFRHSNVHSFVRQLNIYGFTRLSTLALLSAIDFVSHPHSSLSASDMSGFCHPLFFRERPGYPCDLSRIKPKVTKARTSTNPGLFSDSRKRKATWDAEA